MDSLLPPSSDAARRPPAPGRLELLRTFMNTVDLEGGDDDFSSPARLAEWLIERGLLPHGASLAESDLLAAIAFREALRDVLEANAGHAEAAGALARLDEIAAQVPLRVQIGKQPRLEPERESGVDAAIGRFLAIIYEAVTVGTWQRLKVCRNDTCRWAFYDSSRNRSGTWCTMAICGNRMKGRTFRRRHPAGAAAG
jgi:predicted RNA-binding Zn ribbon-like protein